MLVLAALLMASMLPIESSAGVTITQGRWRDGDIVWYYNGDQKPASVNDADFVELVKQAFRIWSAGCNLSVQYGGPTSVPADNAHVIAADTVVVGWAPLPSGVGGTAGPFSTDTSSNSYYVTAGVVQISADNTPYNLAPDRLLYIVVHEIGHLLNLAHSDEPYSVMYANPFDAISSASEPYHVYADDISTYASLYGSRGLQPVTDHGAVPFTPDPSFGLSLGVGDFVFDGGDYVTPGSPGNTWRPANLAAVDLAQEEDSP